MLFLGVLYVLYLLNFHNMGLLSYTMNQPTTAPLPGGTLGALQQLIIHGTFGFLISFTHQAYEHMVSAFCPFQSQGWTHSLPPNL